ncbi:unnamed protein product (macronuclear) [Paramecium tetraurelia]|uniref:AP180 N-terminal homology (ANTH) domain-containing protein n=1 Tax=Paramecium tetraurelia TaxID=5888 RepID=A0EI94_PARTE|nr:uncharacterized protein GSPATT00027364001 [Paramecium tetraurelia]CAK95035.1 unnamed protein product [Paramecium tetraurelia]|eukprot:XP_001462408.1 hypothetical protein (macronuclear) [Paramecium tetraurelia strain d4-2]
MNNPSIMQFTQKESEFCWLAGLKAISTKQPMITMWMKSEQRKVDPSLLKNEFMKQFQSGFLHLNSIITGDRNKNSQLIKGISDITVIAIVRVIREEGIKEFEQIRNDFQKLITIITYLSLTRSVMSDAVMKFLSNQQSESHQYLDNLLSTLAKIEQMKNAMNSNKHDPIKDTQLYKLLFGKGNFYDPFTANHQTITTGQQAPQNHQANQLNHQEKQTAQVSPMKQALTPTSEQKHHQQQMNQQTILQHQQIIKQTKPLVQVEDFSEDSGDSSVDLGNKYIVNAKAQKQINGSDSDSEIQEIPNFKI